MLFAASLQTAFSIGGMGFSVSESVCEGPWAWSHTRRGMAGGVAMAKKGMVRSLLLFVSTSGLKFGVHVARLVGKS